MAKSRLGGIVIDCKTEDLEAAGRFWSAALGLAVKPEDRGYLTLVTPEGEPYVLVQQVTHESRVHLDIETDDVEAEVRRLEGLGASRLTQVRDWWVMEAPTGQRFCVVPKT